MRGYDAFVHPQLVTMLTSAHQCAMDGAPKRKLPY